MSTKHAKGPWYVYMRGEAIECVGVDESGRDWIAFVRDAGGNIVCRTNGFTPEEAEANAARIVACVNACEHVNPEAVPMMMDALRRIASCKSGGVVVMGDISGDRHEMIHLAREAIAKAAR